MVFVAGIANGRRCACWAACAENVELLTVNAANWTCASGRGEQMVRRQAAAGGILAAAKVGGIVANTRARRIPLRQPCDRDQRHSCRPRQRHRKTDVLGSSCSIRNSQASRYAKIPC